MPDASVLGWWAFAVSVVAGVLVLPLAPQTAEHLRVSVCRSTGGSCGYVPQPARCDVLSRDSSTASALVALRRSGSEADGLVVKALDGTATVTVVDPRGRDLGIVAGQRLGVRVGAGAGRGLSATFRFPRHDDADAWLDHYDRREQPITAAAAGWTSPVEGGRRSGALNAGLHEGLRAALSALGFADLDAVRVPDAVGVDVPRQGSGAAAFGAASSDQEVSGVAGAAPRLELDADGRSATSGEVAGPVPDLLGLAGPATYRVDSDASGRPVRVEVSGRVALTPDGGLVAAERLPLREGGGSRAAITPSAVQTVVLDLRASANRAAFDRLFRTQGPAAVPRAQPDAGAAAALVQWVADDAVYIRTTTRTTSSTTGTTGTTGTETTMLTAFSEDLAVPASRLLALPGCSR
ncbi:MAG: hypothetical protein ACTHN8_08495 [Angustibacter sp.]